MPTGISIHVGLNELDEAHYRGRHTLRGCVADAKAMHELAKDAGFEPSLIIGPDATADAVRDAIAAARPRVGRDGILLVTFSGHGSRVKHLGGGAGTGPQPPDASVEARFEFRPVDEAAGEGVAEPDGVDRHDRSDGWDETWCLYDRQMVDDELYACWADFPRDARILVVSDSCLAAGVIRTGRRARAGRASPTYRTAGGPAAVASSAVRGAQPEATRGQPRRLRSLDEEVSQQVYARNFSMYSEVQQRARKLAWRPVQADVMLLAASEDNQPAADGDNGAFTSVLLEVWNEGKFDGSYRTFHKEISERLAKQTPRLLALRPPSFADQRPFTI